MPTPQTHPAPIVSVILPSHDTAALIAACLHISADGTISGGRRWPSEPRP